MSAKQATILVVDTTGEALSLAVAARGKTFAFHRKLAVPHDETLLPKIDALLARAGTRLKDLHAIAAASGPGRFTGIRIGMAYAAVAASQLKIPSLALSRLEALAFKTPGRLVGVALPGWREETFAQLYRRGAASGAPAPAEAPRWLTAETWKEARTAWEKRGAAVVVAETTAADLIAPAVARLRARRPTRFEPLYLKPAGYELRQDKAGAAR